VTPVFAVYVVEAGVFQLSLKKF